MKLSPYSRSYCNPKILFLRIGIGGGFWAVEAYLVESGVLTLGMGSNYDTIYSSGWALIRSFWDIFTCLLILLSDEKCSLCKFSFKMDSLFFKDAMSWFVSFLADFIKILNYFFCIFYWSCGIKYSAKGKSPLFFLYISFSLSTSLAFYVSSFWSFYLLLRVLAMS